MAKIKRLLETFKPENYDLTWDIDPDGLKFNGIVNIQGEAVSDSDSITLHSNDLKINSATIDDQEAKIGKQTSHHEVELTPEKQIKQGKHEIKIRFEGKITDAMVGIYPSNFKHKGNAKRLISTQFESNHAREAFPCIDEPAAKATFNLTLITPDGIDVISNTPVKSQSEDNNKLTTTFEPTPKMSSYLLVFAAGEMQSVSRKSKNGVDIKAWSSIAQPLNYLDFSADEAVKILDFFEEYFGIPYPLEKLDMVALPDFDAGAMENWGLITYREIAMLADPDNRSISNEQYVSMVVAHEISHMWFGNLVTMNWWDDLWLNESFASLMEHVALNAIHPDWNQWEHYAANDIISTTSRDIHADIQPISIELDDPDLIETMFDPGIVYTKGGRLLKMLMEYIGEDAFRSGLTDYFTKHGYGNTVRNDLWACLADASGKDVDELMTSWLNHPGMPVLSVDQNGNKVEIAQTRFVIGDAKEYDQTWPIPLLSEPVLDEEILTSSKADFTVDDSNYILVNKSASGHYITHYTNLEHREFIAKRLGDGSLQSDARINILNDAILLSRKDIIQYDEALNSILHMTNEQRYPVWGLIARIVSTAQQLTEGDEDARANLMTLRKYMASPLIDDLGYEDNKKDDANTTQLRSIATSFMLGAEDDEALKFARDSQSKAGDPEKLQSESRSILLSALVKSGDKELVDNLVDSYTDASADMQLDIVSALASTKDPAVATEVLDKAIGESGFVRTQDILRWIAIFLRNHYIREAVWDNMVGKWEWLESALTKSKSFDYLPTYCAAVVSTDDMAKRYKDLFVPLKDNKLLKRNIAIGLKDIDARVSWRKSNQAEVTAWLDDFSKNHS